MNVFLIETPHQLLNSIEARHSLKLCNSHLIILTSKDYPRYVYGQLVQEKDWKTVHYIPSEVEPESLLQRRLKFHKLARVRGYYHHYETMVMRRRLDTLAGTIGKVKNVFLGNYWVDYMRHFANVLNYKKLYLLDDGTQTLQINERRKSNSSPDNYTSRQRLILYFIRLIIGMKTKDVPSTIFYTIYDLSPKNGDQVIKHDYSYLRCLSSAIQPSDEIFFLGSELSEEGLSIDRYLVHLKEVLKYFESKKVVYIAHKREPSEQIAFIKDVLKVQITNFGVPIEYQLMFKKTKPRILSSFCSSALENCRIIFGETLEILSFYIDPKEFRLNPELIRNIYSYYESKQSLSFKVVKL